MPNCGKKHRNCLLSLIGLRYNGETIEPGAQTERRGEAGPLRLLLGGGDSPASLIRAVDSATHRAVLGVADALAAVGVKRVGRRHVAGTDGGIGRLGRREPVQRAGFLPINMWAPYLSIQDTFVSGLPGHSRSRL